MVRNHALGKNHGGPHKLLSSDITGPQVPMGRQSPMKPPAQKGAGQGVRSHPHQGPTNPDVNTHGVLTPKERQSCPTIRMKPKKHS